MNITTRGFSSLILLIALAAVVLVGGGYWYFQGTKAPVTGQPTQTSTATPSAPAVPSSNKKVTSQASSASSASIQFDPQTIEVGDMVGKFTVSEVGVYRPNHPETQPNKIIVFSGTTTVLATYKWSDIGTNYLDIDSADRTHLPLGTASFCTTQTDDTLFRQAGISTGGKALVTFNSVTLIYYPADGCFPYLNIIKIEKP